MRFDALNHFKDSNGSTGICWVGHDNHRTDAQERAIRFQEVIGFHFGVAHGAFYSFACALSTSVLISHQSEKCRCQIS